MSRRRRRSRHDDILVTTRIISAQEFADVYSRLQDAQNEQTMRIWADLWNWARIEEPAGEV